MKLAWMLLLFCLPLYAQEEQADAENAEGLTEKMVVTATKQERKLKELPISATVVESSDIAEKASIVAGEELQGVPGVFIRRDGAGAAALSANIRGLTGVHGNDTFLALLDGIPFVSAHEEVLLSELPIGAVDRVEVIRGPVSALYGRGALSGAINYLTRAPGTERQTTLNLKGGSFGYARPHISASMPLENHQLLIDGYYETGDGWRDGTEREATNILIKDEIVLSSSSRLFAYANVYSSTQGVGGQIPLDQDGNVIETLGGRTGFIGYEPNEYDRESIMTALRHQYLIGDQWDLTTTLHYRNVTDNNQLNFFDPFGFDPANNVLRVNGFENDRDTDVLFIEPRITYQGDKHRFIAGVNWERVELQETDWWTGRNGFDFETFAFYFYEIDIDYTTGEILTDDHPFWTVRNETYRGDSTNDFGAIYLQDEWQVSDRTTLTFGLRYDVFERDAQIDSDVDFDGEIDINPGISDDESHLSPKFAINHQINERHAAYASYGEGFNSNFGAVWQWDPGLYERGTDVKPSEVRNIEVGVRGQTERFGYSLSLYNMIQEDRLVFVSDPDSFGPPRASTADEFESSGLEFEAQLRLADGWQAAVSFAHIDAEWNDYTVGGVDYSGNQPIGVPENTLSLGFRGQLTSTARLWGTYYRNDDYMVTLDNRVSGGEHDLLDLGASLAIPSIRGEISLVGKNILDEDFYYLFGSTSPLNATPGLPARFLLSLSLDLGSRR